MKQMDLALDAGVSKQTISDIEKARGAPSILTALRIAEILGFSLDELWTKAVTPELTEVVPPVPRPIR